MPRVFVGLSGGVDSSVAALRLRAAGHDVVGVFMRCWDGLPTSQGVKFRTQCQWRDDRRDALRVAAQLKLPFRTWDFTAAYRERVVEYFFAEYAAGRTPNPDVVCNREIKFKLFLERALQEGADSVATGHYARVTQHVADSAGQRGTSVVRYELRIARDAAKDQSYFLYTLRQPELAHVLFPIGEHTKAEVRAIARQAGLPTAEKPDSQGICFVGQVPVAEFLRARLPVTPGPVVTVAGRQVGEHDGVAFYTIGQRHGLRLSARLPYYVAEKRVGENTLVVGEGPADPTLYRRTVAVRDPTWVGDPPPAGARLQARVRYRQPLELGTWQAPDGLDGAWCFEFDEPQRAVTPGQSLVLYAGPRVVGGGVIA